LWSWCVWVTSFPTAPCATFAFEVVLAQVDNYSHDVRIVAYRRGCGLGAEYTEGMNLRVTEEHDARLGVKEAIRG
jgi:hypothetical protein